MVLTLIGFGKFYTVVLFQLHKTHFVPIISKYTKNTIKNYSEITKNFLSENLYLLEQNKNNYSFAELDFKYWKNKIKLNEIDAPKNNPVLMKNKFYSYYWFIVNFKYRLKSKLKVFNRIRRFIYKS